ELSLLRNTIYARVGNTFRRPWLADHFKAQPWYAPGRKPDLAAISALDQANAKRIAEYDAGLTGAQLEVMLATVEARKPAPAPHDDIERSLLSQRLGRFVGGERGAQGSPLEDAARLDGLLSVDQLATLSRRDLRIVRNTIYARRGRTFESKVVRGYFAGAS